MWADAFFFIDKKRRSKVNFAPTWRRRRDSNPRTDFSVYSLSRGAPYSHLGTSATINSASSGKRWRREWDSNPRLLRVTGFQDRLLKPLGHLSLLISNSEANESIPYFEPYVNLKLRFLWAVFSEPQNRGGQPAGPRPKRPLEKTGSACSAGRFWFLI